jgi:hypothetical protein
MNKNKNMYFINCISTWLKQQVAVITQNDHFKIYELLYSLHIDLTYFHDILLS